MRTDGRADGRQTDRHDEASSRYVQLWTVHKIFLDKAEFRINQMYNQLWQTHKNTHYMKKITHYKSK